MINQDIQSRVDAFRGNPDALAQRYQQSQQLIDLLALQKIKSEKEAAARQMQMQMAQQQAKEGQPPTIAEQREQEVLDLTKNEVQQQQSALRAQQQQQQQAAMQKLLSGIAAAPGRCLPHNHKQWPQGELLHL
jgi:septum formation topological specificity factor MinE